MQPFFYRSACCVFYVVLYNVDATGINSPVDDADHAGIVKQRRRHAKKPTHGAAV